MNHKLIGCLVFIMVLAGSSCNSQTSNSMSDSKHRYTNKLINSSSPYLLQHAHNPVNWYPWGEEALKKAKEEDKLLIISVGYAACHWCHVMEHESFEDSTVAALMNEHFVSIKVDREERPDVDQIYMNAAYMTTGRGGWPLNAIAMPDGRPVFGATYFPKDEWMRMLNHFINLKANESEKLENAAEQITAGIRQMDYGDFIDRETEFTEDILYPAVKNLHGSLDFGKGGLEKAPKFPMPNIHQFLLRYHTLAGDEKSMEGALVTLDEMAAGGIYDQVGGGFARYSTDAFWKVPHFEKMLYDNGQLVSLYAEAYQLTGDEKYGKVVRETLEFIEREMTGKEGGFYSSLDADSEGEEGKFYVWTKAETDSLLGKDAAVIADYFNVKEGGNWEGHNILYRREEAEKVAERHGYSAEDFKKALSKARSTLLKARETRVRPGLDDKILTSWNAIMLKGYVDAYRALGEKTYLEKALANAKFLQKNQLQSGGRLNRNYKDGTSTINGFADDYSFLIEAFVALYQVTFDEEWLFEADKLMQYALAHFYDEKGGMFYYTSNEDDPLITRTREVADNVIPGSNSSFAKGLFLLGTYLYKSDYIDRSRRMLSGVQTNVKDQLAYFSNWGILQTWFTWPPYEVAIMGENSAEFRAEWDRGFHPNAFLLGGNKEGKLELLENKLVEGATYIYVCQDKVCKFPVQSVEEARKLAVYENPDN